MSFKFNQMIREGVERALLKVESNYTPLPPVGRVSEFIKSQPFEITCQACMESTTVRELPSECPRCGWRGWTRG